MDDKQKAGSRRKPIAIGLAVAYFLWEVIGQPLWNLNLERLAEREKFDTTLAEGSVMNALNAAADFVPNSFGLGFVCGALIFAFWDVITDAFKRWILRKPIEHDLRVWVGSITPFLDEPQKGEMRLCVDAVNVGKDGFRISGVEGCIDLTYNDGSGKRRTVTLPPPSLEDLDDKERLVPHGHIYNIYIRQPLPAYIRTLLPDAFQWDPYPNFGFENLDIMLTTEDGKLTKRLKMWESMRVTSGERELRAVQTVKIFKSEEAREAFNESIRRIANRFGVSR